MEAAVTRAETRKCTRCLVELPIAAFYSKGNRLDSACKECVKSDKRTKYVSRELELNTSRLLKVFEIIFDFERRQIEKELSRLDEVIQLCQHKLEQ